MEYGKRCNSRCVQQRETAKPYRVRGGDSISDARQSPLRQFQSHRRDWRENRYVYPVISRRSGGLSIGINLNPDAACNFDCVYCQVDRTGTPRVRDVDPEVLNTELSDMITLAVNGGLFADPAFADVPPPLRRLNDIAFSGDGEPTTCKHFRRCVEIAADLKRRAGLPDVKIVLITDACYLTKPEVEAGLRIMDENNGEIWAKLDAGTEEYYQRVNRPNFPLRHVMNNIIAGARVRPIVIQSIFMQLCGEGPPPGEIEEFTNRLNEIVASGGKIKLVQVYTVARPPAESFVSPLSAEEVDRITQAVRLRTGLVAQSFYGAT